jgi:hypothetical protein
MEGDRVNRDPGIVHDWRRFKTPRSADRGGEGSSGVDLSTLTVRAPQLGVESEYSPASVFEGDSGKRFFLTSGAVACCMSRSGRLAGAHCLFRPWIGGSISSSPTSKFS